MAARSQAPVLPIYSSYTNLPVLDCRIMSKRLATSRRFGIAARTMAQAGRSA